MNITTILQAKRSERHHDESKQGVLMDQEESRMFPYRVYTHVSETERDLTKMEIQANVYDWGLYSYCRREGLDPRQPLPESYMEDSLKIFESVLIYLQQVFRARDFKDFYLATAQAVRAITGMSLVKGFQHIYDQMLACVHSIVEEIGFVLQDSEPRNPFTIFREWLQTAGDQLNNPLVVKAKKIFYHLLSFACLERFGITFDSVWFNKAQEEYVRKEHSSNAGFLYSVIDGVSYIVERLYECFLCGTWTPLAHSSTNYGQWVDSVYALKLEHVKMANPEANGTTYHKFLGELDSAIEKGRAICKYMVTDDPKAKFASRKLLSELEMMKADECTRKAARSTREAPFTVLYNAGSSVGKSGIVDMVFKHFGKVFNLPIDDEYHYTRIYSDPFYSGFTTSMWSLLLDDIAARHPNLGLDPSMEDVLQIVNGVPFTPPQAELTDKGKTPVRAVLVQATTNTKSLNASSYYCNVLAIKRRFPLVVTVIPKLQFSKMVNGVVPEEGARMIDPARLSATEGEYPDYWMFRVERVVAEVRGENSDTPVQFAKHVPVKTFLAVNDFLDFLMDEAEIHQAQQRGASTVGKHCATVPVCPQCKRMTCRCVGETQTHEYTALAMGALATCAASAFMVNKVRKKARTFKTEVEEKAPEWICDQLAKTLRVAADRLDRSEGVPDPDTVEEERGADAAPEDDHPSHSFLADLRTSLNDLGLSLKEKFEAERIRVRSIFQAAGDSTAASRRRKIGALAAMLAAIPTIIGIYKLYTIADGFATQAREGDSPRHFTKDEKPNPWYRDVYHPSSFELGSLVKSWKGLAFDEVVQHVQRQTMFVRTEFERDGKHLVREFRMMCMGGQLYVTNNHNIPSPETMMHIITQEVAEGISENFAMKLYEADMFRIPESDLVFFIIPNVPPRSSLKELLVTRAFKTHCPGRIILRDEHGKVDTIALQALKAEVTPSDLGDIDAFVATASRKTEAGFCGAPYLAQTPVGPVVVGLHIMGGVSTRVAATRLCREDVDAAIAALKYTPVQPGRPVLKDVQGNEIPIQPLHPKSTFRYMEQGNANVYGSLPGFRSASESIVTPTMYQSTMLDAGYTIKCGKPVMRSYEPWRKAHMDIVNQEFSASRAIVLECVEAYANDILDGLSTSDLGEIVVLDDLATVNGLPGVKYIDKMNRNTSMGFPWRNSKKNHLMSLGEHDIWQDCVDFGPDVYTKVQAMEDQYKTGTTCLPVYIEHLKDEVLPQRKIDSKATRVFAACSVDFAFTVRKHLLPLVRVIQRNRFLFECAPGTNATSLEWCEIYHYLTQHGTHRMIAGDFGKFDKRMNAMFILAAFSVLIIICRKANWKEEDLTLLWSLAHDVAFPLTDANGDLVQYWGSNPSGHPLTVIINSIVNSLYMRYVWKMTQHDLRTFKQWVALMTYGDDNAMGVKEGAENFDHSIIQSELAKIGVVYTMADKEAVSRPYIEMHEVSFLQREWIYREELGAYVARLNENSIEKGLLFYMPSKVESKEALHAIALENALREYFFYGREIYETKREFFTRTLAQYDLEAYVRPFPDYDFCVAAYLENNMDYSPDGKCPLCH